MAIKTDSITNQAGTGAPDFPNGFTTDGSSVFQFTNWESFSVTSSWTTNTTHQAYKRRVGDTIEMRGSIALSGAPNSATLTITLPDSLNINTSAIDNSGLSLLGFGIARDVSGATADVYGNYAGVSTEFRLIWNQDAATANIVTQASPWTWAAGDDIRWFANIPIQEWS